MDGTIQVGQIIRSDPIKNIGLIGSDYSSNPIGFSRYYSIGSDIGLPKKIKNQIKNKMKQRHCTQTKTKHRVRMVHTHHCCSLHSLFSSHCITSHSLTLFFSLSLYSSVFTSHSSDTVHASRTVSYTTRSNVKRQSIDAAIYASADAVQPADAANDQICYSDTKSALLDLLLLASTITKIPSEPATRILCFEILMV